MMLENLMGLSLLLDRSVGSTPDPLQKLGPIQAPSLFDPITNLDRCSVCGAKVGCAEISCAASTPPHEEGNAVGTERMKVLTRVICGVKHTSHADSRSRVHHCVVSSAASGSNGFDSRRRILDGPYALLPY